jgi:type II secretory pathway component PulJ
MRRRAAVNGFTLIELLLVLSFLAVVGAALAAVFQTGIKTYQKIQGHSRDQQTARALFLQLERELRHSISVPGAAFIGRSDEISFCTLSLSDPPAVIWVRYQWKRDAGKPGGTLFRRQATLSPTGADGGAEDQAWTEDPSLIQFRYAFGAPDEESPPEWKDAWDAPTRTPAAVSVSLRWGADGAPPHRRFTKIIRVPTGLLP